MDQDIARELSNYGRQRLLLDGLTSLTKKVAHELAKYNGDFSISDLKASNSKKN